MARKTKTIAPVGGNVEQPPRAVSGWTVARIEQAKRLANAGDLSLAADLWEMVLGDERAIGPLQALAGIAAVPVTFETALPDTDSADDPLVADLERDFWSIFPEELQGEIIRWAVGLGVVPVHAASWDANPETGRLLPRYEVWHPRALRFDGDRAIWKIRTRANGDGVELTPGDGEWALFTPYGSKRPWAKAPWYGLGLLWYAAQCAKIGWFDWNDSHATPIRSAEFARPDAESALLEEKSRQELGTKIASLVRGGSIVLPEGYGLKLVEAASENWKSFLTLCNEVWPMAVAIAMTGNNLSTQIEGGSFAASRTAENVTYDRKRTIARCLETTKRGQCLVWWAEFNYASTAPPWPKYGIEPQRDLTAAAARFQSGANGLATLRTAGYEVEDGEEDRLEELLGIRVRRATTPKPPTGAAPPVAKARAAHEHGTRAAADDSPRGLVEGQRVADAIVGQATAAATDALRPDLELLLKLINEATDARELRESLLKAFGDMKPEEWTEISYRAEVLAAMAGRFSAAAEV